MKITILGSTGMLGNAVGKHFLENFGEENVFLSYRNKEVTYGANAFYFDPIKDELAVIPKSDYVINCIGIIKPFMKNSVINAIKINSLLPRQLANYCENTGMKLIHITTDCVFSGKEGSYNENALHDCLDDYGKSKSLGEPENCMVIRTSIIGEEIHKNASLIAWAISQRKREVRGFVNHLWNGITTNQYAKICDQIITAHLYQYDKFHVFSNIINKYELLKLIDAKYGLDLRIERFEAPEAVDRTLSTVRSMNQLLNIPSIADQIENL